MNKQVFDENGKPKPFIRNLKTEWEIIQPYLNNQINGARWKCEIIIIQS